MKIKEDLIAQEPKHREALEDKMEKLRLEMHRRFLGMKMLIKMSKDWRPE